DPAACLAAPAWAEITLYDPAGRFLPARADGPLAGALVPRKRVRITRETGGDAVAHFTGWIAAIIPHRDRTVTLRCDGLEALLQQAEVFPPLLVNAPADAAIAAILAGVDHPPALFGHWLLGLSRLGQDTRLPDLTTYADLEPGRTTFAFAGDWPEGLSAWAALRAVVEAERGLCFVDGAGRVVFWNRHHLRLPRPPALALTDREAVFTPAVTGASLVNRATVTCHPREVGGAGETLWTLHSPLRLPPDDVRVIRARLGNGAGGWRGVLALETPQPGLDYTAYDHPDGSGSDRTGDVSLRAEAAGSSVLLTISNHYPAPIYLQPGSRLRGTPLRDSGPAVATVEDRLSMVRYGWRTASLDLPLLSRLEDAAGVARLLVTEGSTPRARVGTVAVSGHVPGVLGCAIGECVRLVDRQGGHDGLVHVLGVRHKLARGGADHTVTWVVRPVPPLAYWRLGIAGAGELGVTARVVY
ncbi:MAG: hypothetical protein JXN59_16280, partial [Anaerolineae bacterium]|nr:hypothetical protein [Anaerolineae bacterium]